MASRNGNAASFGERLRALMRAKGHTSATSGSGVDVGALSRAAGTSYEMARRYAEGRALPRGDKLQAIAAWLGIKPGALAWGELEAPAAVESVVDVEVLERCLSAVEEAEAALGVKLSPDKAASLVAVLYGEACAGRMTSRAGVTGLVRAMTSGARGSGPERSS